MWLPRADVPQTLTTVNVANGEGGHRFPQLLPGARAVVFTIVAVPNDPRLGTSVALLSLDTGERRLSLRDAADARYLPTGHLVYVAWGKLMAAPFDLRTLQITGSSVGLIDGVMQSYTSTAAQFTLSDSGSLAWLPVPPDPDLELSRKIVWVDQRGKATPVGAAGDAYTQPRLSPDGCCGGGGGGGGSTTSVAAFEPASVDGFAQAPLWTPDGKRLVFSEDLPSRQLQPLSIPADFSAPAVRLTTAGPAQLPASWTPDGRVLVFEQCTSQCDIWALSTTGTTRERPGRLFSRRRRSGTPRCRRMDGGWRMYRTNRAGRKSTCSPSLGPGERQSISTEGGWFPRWSHDGRKLYLGTMPGGSPLLVSLPCQPRIGHTYFVVDVSTHPHSRERTTRGVRGSGHAIHGQPADCRIRSRAGRAISDGRSQTWTGHHPLPRRPTFD